MSGNEASAIGSLRAINSGQASYSSSCGNGGYAVPPAWLMSQFVDLARAGRAYANLCNMQPMPPGTDSINIPKVATGTTTRNASGLPALASTAA